MSTDELIDFDLDKRLQEHLMIRQKNVLSNMTGALERLYPFASRPYGNIFDEEGDMYMAMLMEARRKYIGSEFKVINLMMREPRDPSLDRVSNETKRKAFCSSRVLSFMASRGAQAPVDMTLYRGMGFSESFQDAFMETFQAGREVVVREFMSVTPSTRVAKSFFTSYKSDVSLNVLLVLSLPKGTPMIVKAIDLAAKESEVILPNCTKWIVDSVIHEAANTCT